MDVLPPMDSFSRCYAAILLSVASIASVIAGTAVSTSRTSTQTLSVTFLTPSLGWWVSDRWNPNTGGEGPLTVSQTRDGGLHWQRLAIVAGAIRGSGGSLDITASDVVFADPRDGWLYGNRLYATHDGGRTWRRLPLHASQTVLAVSGMSVWRLDSSCNAATNRCSFRLLTSTAGSDTWHLMAWRPPNTIALGWELSRADQQHAWLVSGPYMVKNHRQLRLLRTIDGGTSWKPLPMPCNRQGTGSIDAQLVPYTLTDLWMFCVSERTGGAQPKSVFRSSDGGRTWRLIANSGGFGTYSGRPHNLTVAGYFTNAVVTSPADGWIALGRYTLLRTIDGGGTWQSAIPLAVANPEGGGVGPVQFVDARHGWLFSFPNLLFRTTDGGAHWQKIRLA